MATLAAGSPADAEWRVPLQPGAARRVDEEARTWIEKVTGTRIALHAVAYSANCFLLIRGPEQRIGLPRAADLVDLHLALGGLPIRCRYLGFALWRLADIGTAWLAGEGVPHPEHPQLVVDPERASPKRVFGALAAGVRGVSRQALQWSADPVDDFVRCLTSKLWADAMSGELEVADCRCRQVLAEQDWAGSVVSILLQQVLEPQLDDVQEDADIATISGAASWDGGAPVPQQTFAALYVLRWLVADPSWASMVVSHAELGGRFVEHLVRRALIPQIGAATGCICRQVVECEDCTGGNCPTHLTSRHRVITPLVGFPDLAGCFSCFCKVCAAGSFQRLTDVFAILRRLIVPDRGCLVEPEVLVGLVRRAAQLVEWTEYGALEATTGTDYDDWQYGFYGCQLPRISCLDSWLYCSDGLDEAMFGVTAAAIAGPAGEGAVDVICEVLSNDGLPLRARIAWLAALADISLAEIRGLPGTKPPLPRSSTADAAPAPVSAGHERLLHLLAAHMKPFAELSHLSWSIQWFGDDLGERLEATYFWRQDRVHPTDASSLPPPAVGFIIAPTSSPDQITAVLACRALCHQLRRPVRLAGHVTELIRSLLSVLQLGPAMAEAFDHDGDRPATIFDRFCRPAVCAAALLTSGSRGDLSVMLPLPSSSDEGHWPDACTAAYATGQLLQEPVTLSAADLGSGVTAVWTLVPLLAQQLLNAAAGIAEKPPGNSSLLFDVLAEDETDAAAAARGLRWLADSKLGGECCQALGQTYTKPDASSAPGAQEPILSFAVVLALFRPSVVASAEAIGSPLAAIGASLAAVTAAVSTHPMSPPIVGGHNRWHGRIVMQCAQLLADAAAATAVAQTLLGTSTFQLLARPAVKVLSAAVTAAGLTGSEQSSEFVQLGSVTFVPIMQAMLDRECGEHADRIFSLVGILGSDSNSKICRATVAQIRRVAGPPQQAVPARALASAIVRLSRNAKHSPEIANALENSFVGLFKGARRSNTLVAQGGLLDCCSALLHGAASSDCGELAALFCGLQEGGIISELQTQFVASGVAVGLAGGFGRFLNDSVAAAEFLAALLAAGGPIIEQLTTDRVLETMIVLLESGHGLGAARLVGALAHDPVGRKAVANKTITHPRLLAGLAGVAGLDAPQRSTGQSLAAISAHVLATMAVERHVADYLGHNLLAARRARAWLVFDGHSDPDRLPWKSERLLWLAVLKGKASSAGAAADTRSCPFAALPPDLLRRLVCTACPCCRRLQPLYKIRIAAGDGARSLRPDDGPVSPQRLQTPLSPAGQPRGIPPWLDGTARPNEDSIVSAANVRAHASPAALRKTTAQVLIKWFESSTGKGLVFVSPGQNASLVSSQRLHFIHLMVCLRQSSAFRHTAAPITGLEGHLLRASELGTAWPPVAEAGGGCAAAGDGARVRAARRCRSSYSIGGGVDGQGGPRHG